MPAKLKLFYQNAEDNFGDVLTLDIVQALAAPREVVWSPLKKADIISLGSLMELALKKRFRRWLLCRFRPLQVWGTGFLKPGRITSTLFLNVHALRGTNSVQRLGVENKDITLGDPGLLCAHIYPLVREQVAKTILATPHLHDKNAHIWIDALKATFPDFDVKVWPLNNSVKDTLEEMNKAAFIASSAMHPLIVAHSYRIPCLWVELEDSTHAGKRYKFEDYYSATGLKAQSVTSQELQKAYGDMRPMLRQNIEAQLKSSVMEEAKLKQVQQSLLRSFDNLLKAVS